MNLKEETTYVLCRKIPEGLVYYVGRKGIGHQFSSEQKEADVFDTLFSAQQMQTELERSLDAEVVILCT